MLFNLVQTNNRFFEEMPAMAREIPFPAFTHYLTRLTAYQVAQLGGWKSLPARLREEVLHIAMEVARELSP